MAATTMGTERILGASPAVPKTQPTQSRPSAPPLRSPRQILRYLLQLDDTAHSIALGTAIGMFIGLTPTVGIQMILVLVVAAITAPLFRFNRVAALITVYVSNPLTMVPLYYFLYWVGTFFVTGTVSRDEFAGILEYDGLGQWWQTVIGLLYDIGWPLLIGTAIVAPLAGVLTYPFMLWLLRRFRVGKRKPQSKPGATVPLRPEAEGAPPAERVQESA